MRELRVAVVLKKSRLDTFLVALRKRNLKGIEFVSLSARPYVVVSDDLEIVRTALGENKRGIFIVGLQSLSLDAAEKERHVGRFFEAPFLGTVTATGSTLSLWREENGFPPSSRRPPR